jgi:2-hydroxy-3-oxopropionate reductase
MVKESLAFIGLGVMGYPMAGHLRRAGYTVSVFNRSPARARQWADEFGGNIADSPRLAAQSAGIVFCCVGNDDDLRQVMLGEEGIIDGLGEGAVVVDHTTTSANVAREMDRLLISRGRTFIDAPVSGGQAGAENGSLTVMCGGGTVSLERVEPVISTYASCIRLLGASGAGQLTKMVNQVCIAGLVQGLAEGLHFARAADLDIEQVVDVISKGAAQSWQMDNRHRSMAQGEYDHGFAVDWMRKDLGYVLQEARENGSQLPVTALVDQFYSEVQALGGQRWDTSSLLARLEATKKN